MKSKKYNRSFARRLTRWVMLLLFIMMSGLGILFYRITKSIVVEVSGNALHSNLNSSAASIYDAMSDVKTAVENNIFDIESHLGQPDKLKDIIGRIIDTNPRIRSCGVSFIANYYPQKGRSFCPYVCRDTIAYDSTESVGLSDSYLKSEWFKEALTADSAYWSQPFFDGRYARTPLTAYIHPIHDASGRVVAILGADLSLGFVTEMLQQQDSLFIEDTWILDIPGYRAFNSYVLANDGTYITHPDHRRILKGKFFTHIKDADEEGVAKRVIKQMMNGKRSTDETSSVMLINRVNSYLFYIPLDETDWMLVTSVPIISLDMFGILSGSLMLVIIVLVLIVTFFACRLTIRRIARPLKQLAATADEVASGQLNAPLPAINSHDEIHQLRDSFENMQQSLFTYIEELKTATASKASIERELNIAHNIQMAMLPKIYPPFPERHDLDIYGEVMPAKAVGGDLYDFFIRDEKLIFCIGDVSGKGVPASLVMAVTCSLFRNIAAYTQQPENILKSLNDALTPGNDAGMFVTLFVGVIDLNNGLLHYSNAGHNPPLLLSGNDVSTLPCDANIAIGVMPDMTFSAQQLQLNPSDTVFLYTDGLNEAENRQLQQFGTDQMLQVAKASVRKPRPLIDAMSHAVHLFAGDAEQSDDLTMLAVQYTVGNVTAAECDQ